MSAGAKKRERTFAPETIAAALVEADRTDDATVAAKYGIARRTISDWRARAAADPDIRRALAAAHRTTTVPWRDEQARTYVALAKQIRALAEAGHEIPFTLIAAAKAFGSGLLQGDTLLSGVDDADDDGTTR